MSNSGQVSLGELRGKLTMLKIACGRCDRRGLLRLDRLIAEHGAGMGLPVLGQLLAGDCPRLGRPGIYDRCGVGFPQLPGLFMPANDARSARPRPSLTDLVFDRLAGGKLRLAAGRGCKPCGWTSAPASPAALSGRAAAEARCSTVTGISKRANTGIAPTSRSGAGG